MNKAPILERKLPGTARVESMHDWIIECTKDTVLPLCRVFAARIVAECLTANGLAVNVLPMQDSIAVQLSAMLGTMAVERDPMPLYRSIASLLNIRQLPTAQAWFVDGGCRLDYHNMIDHGSPLCCLCGVRPCSGSGLLLCLVCASKV